jgi:hypothetical protein
MYSITRYKRHFSILLGSLSIILAVSHKKGTLGVKKQKGNTFYIYVLISLVQF